MSSMAAFLFQNSLRALPFGETFIGITLSVKNRRAASFIWL